MDSQSAGHSVSDWSHVKEVIRMLHLAICQLETSINESNRSMDSLTSSFTQIADHARSLADKSSENQTHPDWAEFSADLNNTSNHLQNQVNSAITAFQFYDRISQRLDHIANGLGKTINIMDNPQTIHDPKAWAGIQEEVKSSYSMESERLMFEQILRGATVEEALATYQHHFKSDSTADGSDDEVELF